eukprot:COSAG01_NODE_71983_length_254_cov_0.670968_2_plen_57_part_01
MHWVVVPKALRARRVNRLQELLRRDIAAQQLEDRVRAGGAVAPGAVLCECGWSHMDL